MFSTSWAVRMSLLAIAAQQLSTPSSSATDWTSLLSVVVPILTALAPYLFGYLSEKRAQRDWNGIAKAIDVYSRWVEIGDIKAVLLLKRFIDTSIVGLTKPVRNTGIFLFSVAALMGDVLIAVESVLQGNPYQAIPALISLVLISVMLYRLYRNLEKYEESLNSIAVEYNECVDSMSDCFGRGAVSDAALEALGKESQAALRLADFLSHGDPLRRRFYLSALDKASAACQSAGEQSQGNVEPTDICSE